MSSVEEIMQKVKDGDLSIGDATEMISKIQIKKSVTYKVSQKGAISFYGIRSRPITLYRDELNKIVETATSDEFKAWEKEHESEFSSLDKKK
jgi:hypothetical protein